MSALVNICSQVKRKAEWDSTGILYLCLKTIWSQPELSYLGLFPLALLQILSTKENYV